MSTRQERKAIRKKILNTINQAINNLVTAHDGLFKVADRCMYTVEIVTPTLIKLTLVSAKPLADSPSSILCNKDLYSKNMYWGQIELSKGEWKFKRETRIKYTKSYGSNSQLISIPIIGMQKKFSMQDLIEAFQDYK